MSKKKSKGLGSSSAFSGSAFGSKPKRGKKSKSGLLSGSAFGGSPKRGKKGKGGLLTGSAFGGKPKRGKKGKGMLSSSSFAQGGFGRIETGRGGNFGASFGGVGKVKKMGFGGSIGSGNLGSSRFGSTFGQGDFLLSLAPPPPPMDTQPDPMDPGGDSAWWEAPKPVDTATLKRELDDATRDYVEAQANGDTQRAEDAQERIAAIQEQLQLDQQVRGGIRYHAASIFGRVVGPVGERMQAQSEWMKVQIGKVAVPAMMYYKEKIRDPILDRIIERRDRQRRASWEPLDNEKGRRAVREFLGVRRRLKK